MEQNRIQKYTHTYVGQLTKVQRQFKGEKIVFSENGAETNG